MYPSDLDEGPLDGAHPKEIAARRPMLATRHFHRLDTSDMSPEEAEKVRKKHDPDRGSKDDNPSALFQRRLRTGQGDDPEGEKARGEK
jgi:hypothetical protein